MKQATEKTGGLENSSNFVQRTDDRETYSGIESIEMYKNSPFGIVTTKKEEPRSFIAIANKRVSEFMTKEECETAIEQKDWTLLTHLINHMFEALPTIKKS